MAEYIEREAVYKALLEAYPLLQTRYLIDTIDSIQTADVVERKRGEWEEIEVEYIEDVAIASMFCPICERYNSKVYHYGNPVEMVNFCPNCGAVMRGDVRE